MTMMYVKLWSALLASGVALAQQQGGGGGVIMWAHGKSATDFYAKSVLLTANWTFCNGDKESFRPDVNELNPSNLRACISRGERFAHIKPLDLRHAAEGLQSPQGLFRAIADAGWSTVVVLHRENSLSHQLSGINWALRHERTHKGRDKEFRRFFCERGDNIALHYMPERRVIVDGIDAALDNGLRVLFLTYADVTTDTCGAVQDTLKLYGSNLGRESCVLDDNNAHSSTHVELPLSEHIGREALGCAVRFFANHPEWAWMLDNDGRRNSPPAYWKAVDHNITHPFFYRHAIGASLVKSTDVVPVREEAEELFAYRRPARAAR